MGWMELLVVGVVALIVVGPKDLPVMFQTLGRIMAKVKRMAREFQTAMSDAAKASGTSDISKELKGLTSPKTMGLDKLKSAADSFERWDPMASQRQNSGSGKGPETAKLTEERAQQAKLIRERTAKAAKARLDREAEKETGKGGDLTEGFTEGNAAEKSGTVGGNGTTHKAAPVQTKEPDSAVGPTTTESAEKSRV